MNKIFVCVKTTLTPHYSYLPRGYLSAFKTVTIIYIELKQTK